MSEHKIGLKPLASITKTFDDPFVTQIFIHNLTHIVDSPRYRALLPGIEKYPERALLLARPGDLVCVLKKVEDAYLDFLSDLGLGPNRENVVVAGRQQEELKDVFAAFLANPGVISEMRDLMNERTAFHLQTFISSQEDFKMAALFEEALNKPVTSLRSNLSVVERANHKHYARTKAVELEVPVPPGEIVEMGPEFDLRGLEAAIRRQINTTGKVIVKGSYGFSGSSITVVENDSGSIRNALSAISNGRDNDIFVVEAFFNVRVSPNFLMYIDAEYVTCVAITDQLLDANLGHEGNSYPSRAKTLPEMHDSAQKISRWLQEDGYRGFCGFDFGEYVDEETGGYDHFLSDINPRINASAYPKALMERLNREELDPGRPPIDVFLSANMKTNAKTFSELSRQCGPMFFSPRKGKGIVPYNTGCLEYGKFTAAILGKSWEEVLQIYDELGASLL
jgi:hypothetical protein